MPLINFGKDKNGQEIDIDLDKEGIRFLLIAGETGSGKSYLMNKLSKQLCEKYSSKELKISLIDMKKCDLEEVKAEYMLYPIAFEIDTAFEHLETIAKSQPRKKTWIQINECDMVYKDKPRMEKCIT